jgi:hypothetical protein
MSTTSGDEYELIEVPVQKKIEIKLTLDDMLEAIAQQANSVTSGGSQAAPPDVLDRLRQLGQMAQELKARLGQANRPGGSV